MTLYSTVILDPFPFGMGVTALEALALGIPVITLPTRQTVPCLVRGMLLTLDIPELIANDEDAYISTAINIANNLIEREVIKAKIAMNMGRLYSQSTRIIRDWSSILRRLHLSTMNKTHS